MKKLFIFYGISTLVFFSALIVGLVLSFFIQIPSVIEILLQYTPVYVVFIILFFSMVYNRDLHFAKIGNKLPVIIFTVCVLIFTFWGVTTYLGRISSTYNVKSYNEEKQFEDIVSENLIIESQNKDEYIYSWQEKSTGTTYTAHMPYDEALDGIIVETQGRERVSPDVHSKAYFEFFVFRFITYCVNPDGEHTIDYGQKTVTISWWFITFLLLLIGAAFCMPVLASGLCLKRFFQLLFYINVIGIYNILLNIFIGNLIIIIILSVVAIFVFFTCIIFRIHNSFKHSDLEDQKENFNPFGEEEFEEKADVHITKKQGGKHGHLHNIGFAYLLCIVVSFIWLLFVWFIFPTETIKMFFLQYGIPPTLLLLFILVAYRKKRIFSKHFITASLITYIPVFFLYVIFLGFISSNINDVIQKTKNEPNFKNKIIKTYDNAVILKNENEMFELSKFYKKKFPEDPHRFIEVEQFVGGKNVVENEILSFEKAIAVSESITPLNFTNLSRLETIQYIADYIEDGHFYAAKLLITNYKSLYGVDTQRITQFESSIDKHVRLDVPSYSQQAKIQVQKQIQYLYNVLSKQEVTLDVITAYYQAIALYNGLRRNVQLQWLVTSFKELIEKHVFYAGDARLPLLKEQGTYSVVLVEKTEQSHVLWAAKDASYYKGAVYFESLELLSIDQRLGRKGEILWHIKVPYAKLVESKLMLYSLEYGSLYTRYVPQFIVNNTQTQLAWAIDTLVSPKDVLSLQPREEYIKSVQDIDYMFYFPRWEKHSLSPFYLYSNILDHLFKILLFMGSILFLVYMRILYFDDETYSVSYILRIHALYMGVLIFLLAYYRHLFFTIDVSSQMIPWLRVVFWIFVGLFIVAVAVVFSILHMLFLSHKRKVKSIVKD